MVHLIGHLIVNPIVHPIVNSIVHPIVHQIVHMGRHIGHFDSKTSFDVFTVHSNAVYVHFVTLTLKQDLTSTGSQPSLIWLGSELWTLYFELDSDSDSVLIQS